MDLVVPDAIEINPKEIADLQVTPEHKKVWYQQSYWAEKGKPLENFPLTIGENQITICNFNPEIPFADNFSRRALAVITDVAVRFPSAIRNLKWIVIDDQQIPSLYGDEAKYPLNRRTLHGTFEETMILAPRAFADTPHRIDAVSNFEGTLVHELGHQLEQEFDKEWDEKFPWRYAGDDEQNWIFDKMVKKIYLN